MSLLSLYRLVPRFSTRLYSSQAGVTVGGASNAPCSKNDTLAPRVRNKNPMNLEKMLIGKKPRGWELEHRNRNYWNKLELSLIHI